MGDPINDLEMPNDSWWCPTDRSLNPSIVQAGYSSYIYLAPIYMDPRGYHLE